MHDIKWIREHAEEFDRGLARRGHPPAPRNSSRSMKGAAPRSPSSKPRSPAQRRLERDRPGQGQEGRGARGALIAEVAGLKAAIEAGEEEQRQPLPRSMTRSRKFRTCRSMMFRRREYRG